MTCSPLPVGLAESCSSLTLKIDLTQDDGDEPVMDSDVINLCSDDVLAIASGSLSNGLGAPAIGTI